MSRRPRRSSRRSRPPSSGGPRWPQEGAVRTFDLSLVTPEGPAFEGEAEMLIVPGASGEIGVLARHAPLVAMLKAGRSG